MKNILPLIPALIHVYIFVLESILWERPRTNKLFGIRPDEVAITKLFAFNQGFYNLFLALAIIVGLFLENRALVVYGLLSIIAAGIVLVVSKRKLWRAALIQIVPALVALLELCLS
ncbi:DUF1304 domain-containing protein [Bdellovibrio sp. HCB337]|uniref:DUF1304 domain-containing protein n=1 Tax=Bdellovibrio sp. HCB337 TaxID=3394358 RepID=UPI0039A71AB1